MPGTGLTLVRVEVVVVDEVPFARAGLWVMMRSRTPSSPWNRWRRFTINREKSRVPNSPVTTGVTKSPHRRSAVARKLRRSRPVCLLSES